MFGLGVGELLVCAVFLLVVVGPRRLPGLMRTAGRVIREARGAARDLVDGIKAEGGLDLDLRGVTLDSALGPPKVVKTEGLSADERWREQPPEGVDLAELSRGTAKAPLEAP